MPDTFLKVPFSEKDAAKSLGARWDGKHWFVPEGRDLAPFVTWLPEVSRTESGGRALATPEATSTDLQPASKGIPLSRLLAGVGSAVAQAFKSGVWTTAEVLRASSKDGHVYLELSERDANGRVVAKAQAAIWASTAARIVPEFERATGAELGPGIKLMVRAKPVFKAQYGFSLEIDGIDPAYTLGDLEAKKRDIRERLQREGVFGKNRALPAPWDYGWVLVIAPQGGAGLGDFSKEAGRLERYGVCKSVYAYSRFQGEGAAREVLVTLQGALASWNHNSRPDAVAIIRGGGAVNDLAWLDDYDLARFVCDCNVPVLTGIGHERDSTVLDEVAHQKFDTPSKVVTGIEQQVARRTREAQASMDAVLSRAVRDADRMRGATERLNGEVKAVAVSTVGTARSDAERLLNEVSLASVRSVHEARTDASEQFTELKGAATAQVTSARHAVPSMLGDIRTWSFRAVNECDHSIRWADDHVR